MQLAECLKVNANYMTIYTAIVDGHSDTCKTAAVNFVDTFHDMRMSPAAVKTIKKAVNVILYLSRQKHYQESRRAKRQSCTGYRLNNLADKAAADKPKDRHLCTFVTLTLPASQRHTDIEITKYCVNPMLAYWRKYFGVMHYIWKKELQKNGNLHFHFVTDRYIDALSLRRAWNRVINRGYVEGVEHPFDYVDRYHDRMSNIFADGWNDNTVLSYLANSAKVNAQTADDVKAWERQQNRECTDIEYTQIYNRNKFAALESMRKSYKREMAETDPDKRWRSPNTTDISAIRTPQSVSAYVAKYIAKDMDETPEYIQYLDETRHYKDMIYFSLRDIAKKKENNEPITDIDRNAVTYWKDLLTETRQKFCPIKGKLWYKSASLTPFVSGASDIIHSQLSDELKQLIDYLHTQETDKHKKVIVSYQMKEDGTADTDKIICVTLLINIFQLQMMREKHRYRYPNIVGMWQHFVDDCKAYNEKRGLYTKETDDFKEFCNIVRN